MSYILDACALFAYINEEPGWEKVDSLLARANAGDILLYMHSVNLLEVYYGVRREQGTEKAEELLEFMDATSLQITDDLSPLFFREAGRLKAAYSMSLADTFCCTSATMLSATLVTADGEMQPIVGHEPIDFFWFRPPKAKQP
jgi:predicted nucleic acid-binding protein